MRQLSGTGRHGGTQITCAAAELSPEKKRGERGTVPHRTLGRVFRNSGARAELGGERIEEWRTHLGGTAEAELGLQWQRRRSARAERGLRGANGSEGGGGRGRALLVADRDASTLPHARHAAARLCRRATAARHGRPRGDPGAGKGRARACQAGFGQRARIEAAAC